MTKLLRRLYKEEEGATMVEYGLMVAAIAVVVGLAAFTFGDAIKGLFEGFVDGDGNLKDPSDW